LLARPLQLARRIVPLSIRLRLRRWMFASLDLTWQARSGILLRIERYTDWTIYNEIFIDGDYDEAIALAFNDAERRPLHIVDLGANAGFFTLRLFDRLRARVGAAESLAVTAIEADPGQADEYESRVMEENGLRSQVQFIGGLAGRRSGTGQLITDCATTRDNDPRIGMPYLDLSPILGSVHRIDLLKCDIEGAEQDLIESYPDLFAKTRVAVFEFHTRRCNIDRCRALLRAYGFTHETMRRPDTQYPLCTVWR
jgi:FkbM family methyltransferase